MMEKQISQNMKRTKPSTLNPTPLKPALQRLFIPWKRRFTQTSGALDDAVWVWGSVEGLGFRGWVT